MGFIQDITGSSAKKDLKQAKKKSDKELQAGYDQAQPFLEEAKGLFQPFVDQGVNANKLYGAAIGLGTPEEQTAAEQRYFQDPAMQAVLGQQTNALLRKFNAGGSGTGGGRLGLAGARVGLENYNGWLDRLNGTGNQGLTATSAQSGILGNQADMRFGLGMTKAGQEINFGNAMAQSRNTGVNNLLNLAGTAVKAYAASDVRLKRDIECLGALPSGLPVYSFRYIWSDEPHIGVMAHEAAEFFPDAVMTSQAGTLLVDYSKVR